MRSAPVRSYLPDFDVVKDHLARSPDIDERARQRIADICRRLADDEVELRGVGAIKLKYTVGNWYDYDSDAAIMVNRHDFLLPLVQSAILSGDSRAVDMVNRLFAYWVANFRLDALLRCDTPIDAAIRLLNWAWVFNTTLLQLAPEQARKLCKIIYIQIEYIASWQSAGGNHLVLEALAGYVYGTIFRSTTAGARWHRWGRRCLLKQVVQQTTTDGVHTEQSMFYHQAVSTHFLKFVLAAASHEEPVPEPQRARFAKMLDYVHETMKPNLAHPVLGDGEALSTDDREHWEAKALLAARYRLFQEPIAEDFLPQVNDAAVWLLGIALPDIRTTAEPLRSTVLEGSGLAVLRDGDRYVFFDAAPFSDPEFPHHGHADALQVEVSAGSHNLFIDPGGYGYYDNSFRRFFRSTAAHNTITLDGMSQSQLFGVLGYGRLAKAHIVRSSMSEHVDYIAGTHDGFRPCEHEREVLLYKHQERFLVIIDRLSGAGEHEAVSRFHLSPELRMNSKAGCIEACGTPAYCVHVVSDGTLEQRVVRGAKDREIQGWVSPETRQTVESDTWEIAVRFVESTVIVVAIALEEQLSLALRLETTTRVRIESGRRTHFLSIPTDGRATIAESRDG